MRSAPATARVVVTTTPIPTERLPAKVVKAAVLEATSNIQFYDCLVISERNDIV